MSKIPVVILTGPTAIGKTKLSIELAKAMSTEIISADSMQLYKYMDIGTAKVTDEEMEGIKHYMIDEVDPDFDFSVAEFQQRCQKYMEQIDSKDMVPLVTGGTGLYLNSIMYDMDFSNVSSDNELRKKLEAELEEHGAGYLYEKLQSLSPQSAKTVHPNNIKRVIRALEIVLSGEEKKDFSKDLKINEKYDPILIILNRDREELYDRINRRVDIMVGQGLLKEVIKLLEMGYTKDMVSMKAIGYKEMISFLEGEYTFDEAVEIIKRDSRRYAKRQITWFKRYKEAVVFDLDDTTDLSELKDEIMQLVKLRLNIEK